jgi:threonine/homoserine/homoserine lactone efflux protein
MDLSLFPRGLAIGFAIAAPVGPIGVLCIRRSLADGRAVGFATGLGAATADAFYAALAALGLTALGQAMSDHADGIRLVGGLALCYLGVRTLRAAPRPEGTRLGEAAPGRAQLAGAYATTVGLTLANPATILSFVAVFAGLGAAQGEGAAALLLVLGVFLGSALWWLFLSNGAGLLGMRIGASGLRWVNVGSGAILLGFGLVALVATVR